ncbi:MAG: 1,4-dihydroxy-2-naphthoate polyprenyltransferase [Candidatus Nanopelagicales bacterium]|jgi:1,4-dihydroxy-2-naphthoate octaprenyltransferase
MTSVSHWVAGARPRTLPAAVAPVLVGTALAGAGWLPVRALLALVVSVSLQVGVNYANDYSDGIRGTDRTRVGPVRLVGQGLAPARRVRGAAILAFAVAAVAGVWLVAMSGHWWLLGVGAASIAAAWLYTGGPRPYGYIGLGEIFVFIFFGLVPVLGTLYVQTSSIDVTAVLAAVGVGALACAILVTNNLRDIPTDSAAGKRTIAVRLGDRRTRTLFVTLIATAYAVVVVMGSIQPWILLGLVSAPWAIGPVRIVRGGAVGPDLIPALVKTGRLVIAYAVALTVGLLIPVIFSL